ncbi:MAG: aminotransferase class III-fold pyridoxal phosphate-dependent enzyme, partial [Desulfobacterales bacterium]|nr:aminotransferase class III-fold pyridoxal phosphate-dependent enzyme [Desulfobacterales bacterium]
MTKKYQQSESYIARESEALGDVQKIRFFPFVGAEGKGVRLCDLDGNEYLDFTASGGVIAAGYGHPRIREAIIAELDHSRANMHCILPHPLVVELGERLVARMPGDFPKKAWFGATGSDANDCLAKLVPPAAGRRRMICYVGGYHGSTLGSAAITGHKAHAKVISGGNVTKVPYPYCYRCLLGYDDPETCSLQCLKFLEDYALSAVSPADDTAAIIMEVIQSDGGEIVPPPNYIPALRELCDKYGIWLLFDEIKTGLGRTGKYFAFEHYDISADGISLAKPLGGGLPLSAVLARQEILDQSIFNLYGLGGAPVPCAAALATLQVIEEEGLTDNAAAMGDRLLE